MRKNRKEETKKQIQTNETCKEIKLPVRVEAGVTLSILAISGALKKNVVVYFWSNRDVFLY